MTCETIDILVSGGGVAGLTAAAAFGAAGFSVICVDPMAPVTAEADPGADLRSTAFLQPSIAVLEKAGLWQRLAPHAAALQIMRIIDAGGVDPAPRLIKDFDASDISDQPFGWNLPNWLLRREILAALQQRPNVDFRPGIATKALTTRAAEALVTLSDGSRISAKLVIAADGRNSTLRQALDIPVKTIRYGQKALVFAVGHDLPHHNVSTEIHRSGGPFTLVPLQERDGRPASAVVWMERGPEAARLAALPEAEFTAAINQRSCGILGELQLLSKRALWPIIAQSAAHMAGERCALLAEAAHVVPPIGAQGLNMSLADLAALLDLAEKSPATLGDEAMLQAYHRARHFDIETRLHGIDLLNRASMIEAQPLRDLRAKTLEALYSFKPLRQKLMRSGLGLK